MFYVYIAIGIYLTLGIISVAISYKDIIAPNWWAWLVVVVAWPLFWFHLFRGS